MNEKRIYLSPPDLTGKESRYLGEALQSNWIAPIGPHLEQFEQKIADYTGFEYALAVNSGTSAIHLSLLALGVQKDDLVISSTLTFCGAVNPILYIGAQPILVDSSFDDWNIDLALLEEAIASAPQKPKAILATHLFGMPVDFIALSKISKQYDIPVIHDLAEAIGCSDQHQKPGALTDSGILSFNGNKLITTSSGGAFLTNDLKQYQKAKLLATQAKSHGTSYNHVELGYNYKMSNVLAGLGLGQLTAMKEKIQAKRKIFERYKKAFSRLEGVEFQKERPGAFSDRWLSAVFFDPIFFSDSPVPTLIANLAEANIESRHIWKPMHLQPLYADAPVIGGGVSQSLFENGICLPSGTSLSEEDQDRVIEIVINDLRASQGSMNGQKK